MESDISLVGTLAANITSQTIPQSLQRQVYLIKQAVSLYYITKLGGSSLVSKNNPLQIKMDFPKLHAELKKIVSSAIKTKRKIVLVDEVIFTSRTLKMHEFNSKGSKISAD